MNDQPRSPGHETTGGWVRLLGDSNPGPALPYPHADRGPGGHEHGRDGGEDLGLPITRGAGRRRRDGGSAPCGIPTGDRHLAGPKAQGQGDPESLCGTG